MYIASFSFLSFLESICGFRDNFIGPLEQVIDVCFGFINELLLLWPLEEPVTCFTRHISIFSIFVLPKSIDKPS